MIANPFLNEDSRDVETAILLEQAFRYDIGKAVAYTDGRRIFINTEDNLYKLLPHYDKKMLKWILWHERYHKELNHHKRFHDYLKEIETKDTLHLFHLSKDEVNIIMDILVHDSLSKLFPDLIETAVNNLAQMRERNSLLYTFKTHTLEKMLTEYAEYKKSRESEDGESKGEGEEKKDGEGEDEDSKTIKTEKKKEDEREKDEGKDSKSTKSKSEDKEKENKDKSKSTPRDTYEKGMKERTEDTPESKGEHQKTDWSKLEDIDQKEFIKEEEGNYYEEAINDLKRKKIKLGKLTQTLNGLTTNTRRRSYAMPSTIYVPNVLLKGRVPGKTALWLCFDASGSMNSVMSMFKEIIGKSIPQAMLTPTTWFSGYGQDRGLEDPEGRDDDYYKGTFKDFMKVYADCGYNDDGDRTIELCWRAEQKGYSPIGITDGGGGLDPRTFDKLKQLQRTILVGPNLNWLQFVQKQNPKIQILEVNY